MRSLKVAAISLNARYCKSLANKRSRASRRARSSSSSTSPDGRSLAAFRSSKVAATTRNSVACSSSHPCPEASSPRINEMNSSVTMLKETSVTSNLWREISWSRRSKGPSKLARCTEKPPEAAFTSVASSTEMSPVILTVAPYFTLACFLCNA